MIFHTIRTITVGEFSEMISYSDVKKMSRFNIPVPISILTKAYHKLLLDYNKISNADGIDKEIRENTHKLKNLIHINIFYKIMMDMLNVTAKYGNLKPKGSDRGSRDILIDVYSYIYKREPKTAGDYERIMTDVDLKVRRFKQRFAEQEKDDSIDFEQLVINLEIILAPLNIRDKKLYTLPRFIEIASKKIKNNGRN